jgi:RNA polymerase sigma-70 factor (ECF subfamily)
MSQTGQTDEWLMQQIASGDRQYLAPLVRRYASPLLTYIRRMIGDLHRSEELFQEVFLAVWQKRKQYKYPRRFRSWLFAIATNRCRADFRRAVGKPATAVLANSANAVASESALDPSDALVATETSKLVESAVANLPEQQRMVVVLRVFNGLSYADIATSVGCAEATARSYMHHALVSMRRYLEPRLREP